MNIIRERSLRNVVSGGDVFALTDYVSDLQEELLNKWQTLSHQQYGDAVLLAYQELEAAKRTLDAPEETAEYQLGRIEGTVDVFKSLIKAEELQLDLVEATAEHSTKVREIIRCLYETEGRGLCHGELASRIGSTNSSLSNIMKRVLASGAVSASRSGKNTHYVLSPAGNQYWEKLNSPQNQDRRWIEILERLDEMQRKLNELSQAQKDTAERHAFLVGDRLVPFDDNNIYGPVMVESAVTIKRNTYVKFCNAGEPEDDAKGSHIKAELFSELLQHASV